MVVQSVAAAVSLHRVAFCQQVAVGPLETMAGVVVAQNVVYSWIYAGYSDAAPILVSVHQSSLELITNWYCNITDAPQLQHLP